jgi:hypothetical protein
MKNIKPKEIKLKPCKGPLHEGQLLPLKMFVKHKNYRDGYSNLCKKCNNIKYNVSPKKQTIDALKEISIGLQAANIKLDTLLNK